MQGYDRSVAGSAINATDTVDETGLIRRDGRDTTARGRRTCLNERRARASEITSRAKRNYRRAHERASSLGASGFRESSGAARKILFV